jgi:hypothetical protein
VGEREFITLRIAQLVYWCTNAFSIGVIQSVQQIEAEKRDINEFPRERTAGAALL